MTELNVSPKNTKLGAIPSFSLPSITSCPGATAECKSICYAAKVERIYKNAEKSYQINLEGIKDPKFVEQLVIKLTKLSTKKKNPMTTFRWHVSGDINDIAYLYKMESVMKQLPSVTFYAYTRNWALKGWMSHLDTLRKLPNFTLIASIDDEHLASNILPPADWRTAYVGSKSVTDVSKLLGKKTIVCPNQVKGTVLCDTCKYCFNPKLNATTASVYFIKH
jgi:hypothetical protein